jgi:hypothetical protein
MTVAQHQLAIGSFLERIEQIERASRWMTNAERLAVIRRIACCNEPTSPWSALSLDARFRIIVGLVEGFDR